MQKITKKAFSLILAIVMAMPIILTMPFSASASSGTVFEYLKSLSTFSDNINSTNVYWDIKENAAYFSGDNSFLTLTNTPLSSVTADSGFTISVDVKRGAANRQWARVFDFGNGTDNHIAMVGGQTTGSDNDKRFAIIMKKDGNTVKRYLTNGTTDSGGNVLLSNSNWLATETPDEWHNFKIVMSKAGSVGRLYYYIDETLYFIYEVPNYIDFVNNMKNFVSTYYVGQSQYSDNGTFNGYIRNLTITPSAGVPGSSDLLFNYTFDSTLEDAKRSDKAMGAWSSGDGATYGGYGDHIYLQNAFLTADISDVMQAEANKKNWTIDFCFNFVSGHDLDTSQYAPIMALSNTTNATDENNSFGVSRNGKVYFKTGNIDNYIGDTGVDFTGSGNEYVGNKSRHRLSYSYNDGTIRVYFNDILKFKADVRDNKSFFENISSIVVAGRGSCETFLDVWDLRGYNNNNANFQSFEQIKILGDAAQYYENKMQSGTVYTNAKNAYDKYVEVNRRMDAITFGEAGISTEVAQSVANNLRTAADNMGTWSSKTFSVPSGSENKWNSHDAHGSAVYIDQLYHNVLWSSGISAGNPGENDYTDATAIGSEQNTYENGSSRKNSIRPVIYREGAVLVYTGRNNDDPYMPVMFRARCWRKGGSTLKMRHRSVYISANAQGMYMNTKWRGTDGQLNLVYSWFYHGEKNVDYNNSTSQYNEISTNTNNHSSHCYANVIRFNGSGQFSSNQYSKTINGITWGFWYSNDNDTSNKNQTATEAQGGSQNGYTTTNRPIYVINYKALIDALGTAAGSTSKQVASYKEGGMSDYFDKYQSAQDFNPANYDYSDTANKVNDCANGISSKISDLGVAKRANIYDSLKNELMVSHDGKASCQADINRPEIYTTSSFAAFKDKYVKAKVRLSRLTDNGYETSLGSYLSDLQTAHNNLQLRADFSSLDETYNSVMDDYDELNKSEYTPNSCTAFESYMSGLTYHGKSASQRADTAAPSQSSIDTEESNVSTAVSTYLKRRANIQPLLDTYSEINDEIEGFNTSTAMYTESSINVLINLLNDDDVQKYVTAPEGTVANYEAGGAEEREADGLKDDIVDAYNSLQTADQGEEVGDKDLSAYQAVVDALENIDADAYDYPADQREKDLKAATKALTKTVEYNNTQIKVLKDNITQSLIDAVTSVLQSAATKHVRQYKIQIVEGAVSESNGVTFNGGSHSYNASENAYYATYGTKVNFKADSSDAAWYMEFYSETASRNEQYQDSGKYFSTIVFGNLNVGVKTKADGYKVGIVRNYSDNNRTPISLIDYAEGDYTVPSASTLPYYTFTGYTLNGVSINEGDVLSISEDTIIIANYEAAEGLPFAINVDDDEISGTTATYNGSVTLEGKADTYAWLEKIGNTENYRSFYIGKDVTFYATESITLKPVTEEEFVDGGYRMPSINVRQSGTYVVTTNEKKKVTFNGQFVTDGNANIIEYGVLLGKATPGGKIKASDVVIENIDASEDYVLTRFKSTKDVGAHQFTIAVNGLRGDVIYKGYITYKNAQGTTLTVYTDAVSEII